MESMEALVASGCHPKPGFSLDESQHNTYLAPPDDIWGALFLRREESNG
jgi:hypothetical protein